MRLNKRGSILMLFCLFSMLLVIYGCSSPAGPGGEQKDAGEIKIGVVAMLSGDGADYGVSIKQGLETARDRINGAGGINGKKISLIIEDSRGDKDQAVKAVQKLINEDQVLAIIGPTNSGEMFAVLVYN